MDIRFEAGRDDDGGRPGRKDSMWSPLEQTRQWVEQDLKLTITVGMGRKQSDIRISRTPMIRHAPH